MFSLGDMIANEVKKALSSRGIVTDVKNIGNELVITIKADDIVNGLTSAFPEAYKPMIKVEASDIKVYIKIM
ncbi:hypothetical protein KEJ48_05160 [Candidatus Bathyarchaeota archaeon]|nr:hypothetical protein [Candidatus Bathyarchaeota archaeon]